MSMEAINIPPEILNDYATEPGPEDGSPEAAEQSDRREEAMQGARKFIGWLVDIGDTKAREMGYPGTGKVPPDQLTELYTLVAERNASPEMLRRAPEAAAITITASIIGANYMHHRKVMQQQSKEQKDQTNSIDD